MINRKIRVLVVEDSLTIRKRMLEVLSNDPGIEIVGEAEDGQRGIELCEKLRPDAVTLDMMLPIMNGLDATEYIMAYCPTPILIVSASVNRGELFRTYDALAAGALEVLDKPTGNEVDQAWEAKLVATVKLISRIKVITHPRGKRSRFARLTPPVSMPTLASSRSAPRAIAIGVSTGGPAALIEILRALPRDFPLPILIVIHIGALFASAFAEWLDGQSALPVAYAVDGEPLPSVGTGRVILGRPDFHMVVRQGRLRLTQDPEVHFCRPAVDKLFQSIALEMGDSVLACLLTGMGRDGAEGLLSIREAGGTTLAQDEASSVVFGMPREAIAIGAAEQIVPLDRVANTMVAFATKGANGSSVKTKTPEKG